MASNEGILSGEITDTEYDVEAAYYHVHSKKGGTESDPKTLRIDYRVGFNAYHSEWVFPEHSGWARKKFEKWWSERSNDPPPEDAAMAEAGSLSIPISIIVRKVGGEKYDRIVKYTLPPEKPPAVADTVVSGSKATCETCVNSGYDDGFELVCKLGFNPDGDCSHFEGVTENSEVIDGVAGKVWTENGLE